ncbi:hypothetical protein S245_062884 [Arachis hypogaea]
MLQKRIFGHGGVMISGLDSSVSNDELKHIFGLYGEIKEIYESLEVNHVKFIEFYDGKQIKLEHGHPRIALYWLGAGAMQVVLIFFSELLLPFRYITIFYNVFSSLLSQFLYRL